MMTHYRITTNHRKQFLGTISTYSDIGLQWWYRSVKDINTPITDKDEHMCDIYRIIDWKIFISIFFCMHKSQIMLSLKIVQMIVRLRCFFLFLLMNRWVSELGKKTKNKMSDSFMLIWTQARSLNSLSNKAPISLHISDMAYFPSCVSDRIFCFRS